MLNFTDRSKQVKISEEQWIEDFCCRERGMNHAVTSFLRVMMRQSRHLLSELDEQDNGDTKVFSFSIYSDSRGLSTAFYGQSDSETSKSRTQKGSRRSNIFYDHGFSHFCLVVLRTCEVQYLSAVPSVSSLPLKDRRDVYSYRRNEVQLASNDSSDRSFVQLRGKISARVSNSVSNAMSEERFLRYLCV